MEHFDAEQYLALVERHRVTHSQVVPTMFVRMLKLPEEVRPKYDVSSLQCVDPRRRAVPDPGQAADDRVVGPGRSTSTTPAPRATASSTATASMWLAHPGTVGTPIALHACTSSATTARSCRTARAARSTSRAARSSSTTTTRRRPTARATRKGWSDARRRRLPRRRQLPVPHRPQGVHDHLRRREHLSAGGGERARRPTRRSIDVAVFGVPNDDFGEEVKAVVQPVEMPADADEADGARPRS